MANLNVLVVGGGGREHALVWKISQSPLVDHLYCAPGNGGTAAEAKTTNVPIAVDKFQELTNFALDKKIDLVVIGPDNPLADGIVDYMEAAGLKVFGPTKESARLEASKSHAKQVMVDLGIPTARFAVFQDKNSALAFAKNNQWARVVKEDGLALGKGVIVCDNQEQVEAALDKMFAGETDSAGKNATILLEDRLQGEELSLFVLLDGQNTLTLQASQDHKRRFDGDEGPNTGGMGAYSPVPLYEKHKQVIEDQVLVPLRAALKNGNLEYKGVLFIGIMMADDIPYVLEFNARFGDPETQAIMPRLKSDIVPALLACTDGSLSSLSLDWDERFSCCVVACADQYPEKSSRDEAIAIGQLPDETQLFHAGTKIQDGRLLTNGGRVLAVTALDGQPHAAKEKAYEALQKVSFNGMDYRKDIAWRVASTCHSR